MTALTSALMTVLEAAADLRCSRRQVFKMIADGTLVRGPKYGRQTVVTAESVKAALEANSAQPPKRQSASKRRAPKSFKADLDAMAERQRAEWTKRRPNSPARSDPQLQNTESA